VQNCEEQIWKICALQSAVHLPIFVNVNETTSLTPCAHWKGNYVGSRGYGNNELWICKDHHGSTNDLWGHI